MVRASRSKTKHARIELAKNIWEEGEEQDLIPIRPFILERNITSPRLLKANLRLK